MIDCNGTCRFYFNAALRICLALVILSLVNLSVSANAAALGADCGVGVVAGSVAMNNGSSSEILGCFMDPTTNTLKWQMGRTSAIDLNVPQCMVGVQSAGAALTFVLDPITRKQKFQCDDIGTPNVNGQCSLTTAGACLSGAATSAVYAGFYDPIAGEALVSWSCLGSGATGTSVACQKYAPTIFATCGSAWGTCAPGTPTSPTFDGIWTCAGSGLGANIAYCGGAGADDDSSKLQFCPPGQRLVNTKFICKSPSSSSYVQTAIPKLPPPPYLPNQLQSILCAASGGTFIVTPSCQ
jgi:hypothetical protein